LYLDILPFKNNYCTSSQIDDMFICRDYPVAGDVKTAYCLHQTEDEQICLLALG